MAAPPVGDEQIAVLAHGQAARRFEPLADDGLLVEESRGARRDGESLDLHAGDDKKPAFPIEVQTAGKRDGRLAEHDFPARVRENQLVHLGKTEDDQAVAHQRGGVQSGG